jgi:arylformamidase
MQPIDLTHFISQNMPVYPGTEQPVFHNGCTIENDGFCEKKVTFYSHTGTHIDAPGHIIKNAKTLDELPIEHFSGKAFLLDLTKIKKDLIDTDDLKPYQYIIENIEFLLINTGWSKYWGIKKYFSDYPVLSFKAAKWISTFNLKGIGFDTISADKEDSKDFPVHKTLFKKNIIIIENLANLESLPINQFMFSCFPLKFKQADGSPVRAVAFI